MKKEQKAALVAACIFYVLTIVGFFYFSLTLIVILFMMFTLSICYFSFLCYKGHNDYTGAEHLQQEIGLLKAEKEQLVGDYEILVREKDTEIEGLRRNAENIQNKLDSTERERDDAEKELQKVSEEVRRAEQLEIESLLPPDDDEDEAESVDIIEVARKAIKELEADAVKAGLKVTISSASDRLMVRASFKRLLIMFRNIIDNSIKYMQTAGTLVITISAIEDDIFIVLKDTGKGLPENETKHIFELNYQGSNRISGNGLGLTQAKAIVEHYGGTIYARSPMGNGMGIYIQLPTT